MSKLPKPENEFNATAVVWGIPKTVCVDMSIQISFYWNKVRRQCLIICFGRGVQLFFSAKRNKNCESFGESALPCFRSGVCIKNSRPRVEILLLTKVFTGQRSPKSQEKSKGSIFFTNALNFANIE